MQLNLSLSWLGLVAPVCLMLGALGLTAWRALPLRRLWQGLAALSGLAVLAACVNLAGTVDRAAWQPWLLATTPGLVVSLLVQSLGTVIAVFSARYLNGEPGQRGYVAALAGVLAAVQCLLLADHWLVLMGAWALVGQALQRLLCHYPDRPFALLAAHKKRLADRLADALLLGTAALAWWTVGDGSWTALRDHVAQVGTTPVLQASAVLLALAVVLRSALLPAHGWLIQVMEAPTPVSALLHAGVVNLGGVVLIRLSMLLETSPLARGLVVVLGLTTAVLAGMVMLTRISIKVRLAWSTVAQMGFMLLECGLGLYTLALLHLVGHSLYKAHAFLSASSAVRDTRRQMMRGSLAIQPLSLWWAPCVAVPLVWAATHVLPASWPWWWSGVLGLAWSPLLWQPVDPLLAAAARWRLALAGLGAVVGLTALMLAGHAWPIGLTDAPHTPLGVVALAGMCLLYLCLVWWQRRPLALENWRRWSYAGFYVDEFYTRLALRLWPTGWTPGRALHPPHPATHWTWVTGTPH